MRALEDLWDARGGFRNWVKCRLGVRAATVVVEEHVHVPVHNVGVISSRILVPGVQRLVESGGAQPALWRAELLEQPRRHEVPCAHTPVYGEIN